MNINEIKFETFPKVDEELNFVKCGEIFVNKNGKFRWDCIVCGQEFQNNFIEHVQNHIEETEKKLDIIDELFNIFPSSTINYQSLATLRKYNHKNKINGNDLANNDFLDKYNISKNIKVCLERNDFLENLLKQSRSKDYKLENRFQSFYQCPKCKHIFDCKLFLRNHYKDFHSNEKNVINSCSNMFSLECKFMQSQQSDSLDQYVEDKSISKEENEDLATKNNQNSESSYHCLRNVDNESSLKNHKIFQATKKKFTCQKSELKQILKKYIKENGSRTPVKEKPKESEISLGTESDCGAIDTNDKITKKSKLEKHVCEICGKESSTKYNLNSHINLRHNKNERKRYPCELCSKTFVRKESLQNHVKTFHLKEKPFLCNINKCERRFVDEKALKNHQAFHTNERKFTCSKCGKKYLHKSKLDAHFKIYHVLGRIHQCKECDKSFYDPYTLRNHMICHTGEKPFACDECPAKFPRENALKWHKKVHSGIKDHICKVCGQAYHLFTGLYAHMKTHGIKYNKKIEKGLVSIEKLVPEKLNLAKSRQKSENNLKGNFIKTEVANNFDIVTS